MKEYKIISARAHTTCRLEKDQIERWQSLTHTHARRIVYSFIFPSATAAAAAAIPTFPFSKFRIYSVWLLLLVRRNCISASCQTRTRMLPFATNRRSQQTEKRFTWMTHFDRGSAEFVSPLCSTVRRTIDFMSYTELHVYKRTGPHRLLNIHMLTVVTPCDVQI